jgi:predicted dehydrogenase
MLFTGTKKECVTTEFRDVDADWGTGFVRSSQHFVDALLHGTPADMSPESAIKVLQLCFAVYRASEIGTSVDPRTITGSVTAAGWADW